MYQTIFDWLSLPIAFFASTLFILAFREPAKKLGLIDIPGGRKQHKGEIPLIGGIAMFFGFTFSSLLLQQSLSNYRALYAGMCLLLLAGILDDMRDLSARAKFATQIMAAVFIVSWSELNLHSLGNIIGLGEIFLGPWSIPFTLLSIVGLINSVNMVDGTDGLAGGMIFVMLVWLSVVAHIAENTSPMLPMILASVTLAFLYFNFPTKNRNASIFMGDSGSMVLGYALAWFALDVLQKSEGQVPAVTVTAILILPVSDTLILMIRRYLKGHSPTAPDREHLHHIFERAGFSKCHTVYILLLITALTGAIGVIGWIFQVPEWIIMLIILLLFFSHLYFVLHAWKVMRALSRLRRIRQIRSSST